jgi:hypothetical protein
MPRLSTSDLIFDAETSTILVWGGKSWLCLTISGPDPRRIFDLMVELVRTKGAPATRNGVSALLRAVWVII